MPQRLPTVRQMNWIGIVPQILAMALFAVIAHSTIPGLAWDHSIFYSAFAYLIICRVMRGLVARDYVAGLKAYRAQQFETAISHFNASHDFFTAHRGLDAWRSLLFGVSSPNPYRIMSLTGAAYCYSQIGDGHKAIELFERVLREAPDCTLARAALNMLQSTSDKSDVTPFV